MPTAEQYTAYIESTGRRAARRYAAQRRQDLTGCCGEPGQRLEFDAETRGEDGRLLGRRRIIRCLLTGRDCTRPYLEELRELYGGLNSGRIQFDSARAEGPDRDA